MADSAAEAIERSAAAYEEHRLDNALITATFERAQRRNPLVDRPLTGMTMVVKDMIDIAGVPTTRGSILYGAQTAAVSAPWVAALEGAGALTVGKANLDEFAWGVTSDNPHFGRVRNPRDHGLTPGGSSGGSASAVASGIARLALGTDTAGSIRIPAACCGIVGFRPRADGRRSNGLAPLSPMFDVIGPLATTVADCAAMWQTWDTQLTAFTDVPSDLIGLKVGVVEGFGHTHDLEKSGARLFPLQFPPTLADHFWTIMKFEAATSHFYTYPRYAAQYGVSVRWKLEMAGEVSRAEYIASRAALFELRRRFVENTVDLDVIVSSTLSGAVPPVDCDEKLVREELGRLTVPASALNLAAIAIGNVQFMARAEAMVLRAGLYWERRVGIAEPP